MATDAQDGWISRVLGVVVAGAAPERAEGEDFLAVFRDAKAEVDSGLSRLAASMRETEDEDFIRIADRGLYGLTDGQSVALMKALFTVNAATADTKGAAIAAMRAAAADYRKAVFAHPLAELVDENPFNVEVGLRSKLGAALERLTAA